MEIGISTWSMGDPVEALERIAEANFKQVEIWDDPDGVLDDCLDELIGALEDHDLEACSLHAPFTGLDISSIDEELRSLSIQKTVDAMDIAQNLGCRDVIVHPSSAKYDTIEDYEYAKRLLTVSTEELAMKAEERGVKLAFENMLKSRDGLRVGTTVADLRESLESLLLGNAGICLDTGHAHYNGLDVSTETRNAGDLLTDLHVNDNDSSGDQHRVPGEGTIDWPSFMAALEKTPFSGSFMLEIYGDDQVTQTLENSRKAASKLLGC